MTWTIEDKIDALMRLPWTITAERDNDEGYLIARVAEVPDAVATGETEKELATDMWESLHASLLMRLEHQDTIPLPKGTMALPWALYASPRRPIVASDVAVFARPYRMMYATSGSGGAHSIPVAG